MITFVSKLPLKDVSCERVHEIVARCHSLEPLVNQPITNLQNGFIIQDDDVLAYHIEESSKYDYIFQKSTNELYISIDKRGECCYLIDLLENEKLLNKDGVLDIINEVHSLQNDVFEETTYLPILYFTSSSNKEVMKECANKLKGMIHVVCGNKEIDFKMRKQYRARYADFSVLCNQDSLRFSKSKKETNEEYINRIYYKIQMYMSNLVYEYPFNMNELHNRVLAKLVAETKEQADDRNFAYEVSIERLSDDKMKLMSRINEKETQIILLKNDIENHKAILATVDAHPILHKGKIKEYYAGEQRDVILNVLKDAKESEGCEKDLAELLEEILKENPTVGNRKKLIREIDILTKSTRDIKKIIPDLQKLGYVCQEEGKHVKVVFYGDTRYQTHIVKTGGVYNLRFGYREMKEHFF